jgi:pyrrolysine biosynthesis protein PylD
MTRLRTHDIGDIGSGLAGHDHYLASVTGLTLAALARLAAGCEPAGDTTMPPFCVVPITSGQGIIPSFTETVRDILVHIGFDALVSPEHNEKGLAYARRVGAGVTLWADDTRFVAETVDGHAIDNTEATALAYVTGLDLMAHGLSGKPVLLLGCGPLGSAMAYFLRERGSRLTAYDPVVPRARELAARTGAALAPSLEQALLAHDLIVDATDAPGIIRRRHVTSRTCVSAPGMPCGVAPSAKGVLSGRLLHDPLQMGVATMAFMAHRLHAATGARAS